MPNLFGHNILSLKLMQKFTMHKQKNEKILRRLSVGHYIRPKHLFQQNDKHQIVHCLLKAVLVLLSRSDHQLTTISLIHLLMKRVFFI